MSDPQKLPWDIHPSPTLKTYLFACLLTGSISFAALSGLAFLNDTYPVQLHFLFDILTLIATLVTALFMWNSRKWWENNYFVIIGISLQYVGLIEMIHLIANHSYPVIPQRTDYNLSLWSLGLLLQNGTLAIAPLYIRKPVQILKTLAIFSIITCVTLIAIFRASANSYFTSMPYRAAIGITEGLYSVFVLIGTSILLKRKRFFERSVFEMLLAAYIGAFSGNIVTLLSHAPYDLSMSVGHALRIVTLYLFYGIIVETGLKRPYRVLFHDLQQHQEQLRKEKDQLARYLDTADIIIVLLGSDERIRLINKKGCKLLGSTQEQLLDKNWFDECIPVRVREPLRSLFHRLIQGRINLKGVYKNSILTKNGKERFIAWSNAVLQDNQGTTTGVICSGVDITDRKKAYEKIDFLASFPEMDPNPICEIDFKGKLTYSNPALLRLFPGIASQNLKHAWFKDMSSYILGLFKSQEQSPLVRQINIDDEYYEQHLYLVPAQSHIRVYGMNITQRKKAELIIQKNQNLLKAEVLQSTEDLIETNKQLNTQIEERKKIERELELKNRLLQITSTAASIDEYLRKIIAMIQSINTCPAIGIRVYETKKIRNHFHQGIEDTFWNDENNAIEAGHECLCFKGIRIQTDIPHLTSRGTFYCEDTHVLLNSLSKNKREEAPCRYLLNGYRSFATFRIQHAEILLGTLHCADTERNHTLKQNINLIESLIPLMGEGINKLILAEKMKIAQDKLGDAKRLSDIGALAAVVAHELRNPLAAMLIASYNLKRKIQNPLLDKHLLTIEKKIAESDQIINNLLFYSHFKKAYFESTAIADLIEECVQSVQARFAHYHVTFESMIEDLRACLIDADAVQIKEVLGNILNNAYESLPDHTGTIRLEGFCRPPMIQIIITDTGIGMPEEALNKAYEPFFTTKSKGTGLGLSVCNQIVTLHQGTINMHSKPSQGTIVTITLPIRQEPSAARSSDIGV